MLYACNTMCTFCPRTLCNVCCWVMAEAYEAHRIQSLHSVRQGCVGLHQNCTLPGAWTLSGCWIIHFLGRPRHRPCTVAEWTQNTVTPVGTAAPLCCRNGNAVKEMIVMWQAVVTSSSPSLCLLTIGIWVLILILKLIYKKKDLH